MSPNKRAAGLLQVTFRCPEEWSDRIDAIAKRLSPGGVEMSRNDALRAIVARGLEAFEGETRKPKK